MTKAAKHEPMPEITRTSYLRYRATRRGFDLSLIENILRFSNERYYDVETGRAIAIHATLARSRLQADGRLPLSQPQIHLLIS